MKSSTNKMTISDSSSEPRSKHELGNSGELLVARYLQERGYTICEHNYKRRFGEIDLIASKDSIVAFIEVKLRKTAYFNLSEVVNKAKQRKIIMTAQYYIQNQSLFGCSYRFDVALIHMLNGTHSIEYLCNAFSAPEII